MIDLHAENLFPKDIADRVRDFNPDLVGLTAKTLRWPAVIEIAQMVRGTNSRSTVVVWGPDLSIYPEEPLSWQCLELAVVGEGEETFLGLCARYEAGSELHTTPGTVARDPATGEVIRNPLGEIRKNLDDGTRGPPVGIGKWSTV